MVFGWSGMGRIKFDDDTCPPALLGPADGSCKGARRHQKVDVCRRESSSVAFGAPSGYLRACIGATHTESQARPTRRAASVACAAL